MALIACNCTNCGATLEVDQELESYVCQFCGTKFLVEKAINYYKTVNVTMNQKEEDSLIRKGLRMISTDFNPRELFKLAQELSDISTHDFYPEFFSYVSGNDDNFEWLLKNSDDEEKILLAKECIRRLVSEYNKKSLKDIRIHIVHNYSEMNYDFLDSNTVTVALKNLVSLKPYFNEELREEYEYIEKIIHEELEEEIKNITSFHQASAIYAYTIAFSFMIEESLQDNVIKNARAFLSKDCYDGIDTKYVAFLLRYLKSHNEDTSFYKHKIADDTYLTATNIIIKDKSYPIENVLRLSCSKPTEYMLLKLNDADATIIKLTNIKDRTFVYLLDGTKDENENYFTDLACNYAKKIPNYDLNLVYKEGLSFKVSTLEKVFTFIGKLIK